MPRIVVTGAGSAQSNGVINCLRMGGSDDEIVGLGSDPYDLALCSAHRKIQVPHSRRPEYRETLLRLLAGLRPDMIHFQHDLELSVALRFRDEIEALGVRMLVPDTDSVETCVHKYQSWLRFKAAGITVPENMVISTPDDLRLAMDHLGDAEGQVWLRSMAIGGGGKGALPTNDFKIAREWIESCQGWGEFVAAERLTERSVTWLSIWYEGDLVVAQTRRRKGWAHAALSPSGVTGITRIGETWSSPEVDQVAMASVRAVSAVPHGVYGVDLCYDRDGWPNPTEINIGRFFTTVQFFAEAGVNFPKILRDLCLLGRRPDLTRAVNPLPDGLLWLRAMDCPPRLTTQAELDSEISIA